jgi:hypothetical protein
MLVRAGHSSPILSDPTRKNKAPLQRDCRSRILIRLRRWRIGGTYGVYRIQLDRRSSDGGAIAQKSPDLALSYPYWYRERI